MPNTAPTTSAPATDALLFGWNPMPSIVSAWADRSGRALADEINRALPKTQSALLEAM